MPVVHDLFFHQKFHVATMLPMLLSYFCFYLAVEISCFMFLSFFGLFSFVQSKMLNVTKIQEMVEITQLKFQSFPLHVV